MTTGPGRSGPMTGRTILVTGGTAGIGRATALGLATMGAHLTSTAGTGIAPRKRRGRSAPPEAGR